MADSSLTRTIGWVGLYDDPQTLLDAARVVREAGLSHWDCHSPYPLHGMEDAMGLRSSPVPYITMTAGFIGLAAAIALTGGLSVFQFPILVGGKALFSWQAFVPIFFELFVLFAAVATFGALIVFGKLGRWHSPLHDSGVMEEITGGRFAIVIRTDSGRPTQDEARRLLEQTQCRDIRLLVEIEPEDNAIL